MYKGKTPQQLIDEMKKRLLRAAQIEITRKVKQNLTYEYLGIQSGMLRQTSGAVMSGGKLYVGTIPIYGVAFETGNFNKYKVSRKFTHYERGRKASWTGDKQHRPFLSDAIRDKDVNQKIAMRCRYERTR